MGYRPTAQLVGLMAVAVLAAGAEPVQQPEDVPAKASPTLHVSVDPRVELMSTIFRLAGNREYNGARLPAYAAEVDAYFAEFRDHPAVAFARKLHRTRGVSYDAPMSLAVHLKDVQSLKGKVPWEPRPLRMDRRFRPDELHTFLGHVRNFVRESRFIEFMDARRELHDAAAAAARKTFADGVNLAWFDDFFGTPAGAEFHLIVAMLNGGGGYGPSFVNGSQQEFYCIIGVMKAGRDGLPRFSKLLVPFLVHEFCHAYANAVVDRHADALEASGRAVFAHVEKRMRKMAYGNWRTMMYETLVRASVVRYMVDSGQGAGAVGQILGEQIQGFAWMPQVCTLLQEYEADRETYPTLDAFFPRIAEFFNEYADSLPAKADSTGEDTDGEAG